MDSATLRQFKLLLIVIKTWNVLCGEIKFICHIYIALLLDGSIAVLNAPSSTRFDAQRLLWLGLHLIDIFCSLVYRCHGHFHLSAVNWSRKRMTNPNMAKWRLTRSSDIVIIPAEIHTNWAINKKSRARHIRRAQFLRLRLHLNRICYKNQSIVWKFFILSLMFNDWGALFKMKIVARDLSHWLHEQLKKEEIGELF